MPRAPLIATPDGDGDITDAGARLSHRLRARRARQGEEADGGSYDANLAKGIEGERLVGAALEAQLAGSDAQLIHSLQFLRWGDVDHIVVASNGITVIDAKNWSGNVRVHDGTLRVGGWSRAKEIDKLRRQVTGVELALAPARSGLRDIPVRAVMCLAAEPDRLEQPLGRGLQLAGAAAARRIVAQAGPLCADEIDHVADVLRRFVPQVTRNDIDGRIGDAVPIRKRARSRAWSGTILRLFRGLAVVSAAWFAATHISTGATPTTAPNVDSEPVTPAVPMSVSRSHGRILVRYSLAAGYILRITVQGDGRPYAAIVDGAPTSQVWLGPRLSRTARRVVVQACVLGPEVQCARRTLPPADHAHR